MQLVRTFPDGSLLTFDQGRFDIWCLYLERPGAARYAPSDAEYFAQLQALAQRHSAQMLYADFVAIYNRTTATLSPHVLEAIYYMAKAYEPDASEVDMLLTILYAGMVAEENKERARLRKRVKRLGVHQVLLENVAPEAAATFSRGLRWQEIAAECERRGF